MFVCLLFEIKKEAKMKYKMKKKANRTNTIENDKKRTFLSFF